MSPRKWYDVEGVETNKADLDQILGESFLNVPTVGPRNGLSKPVVASLS